MWGVELAVMAGMIAVNGVFAAFEIALAAVSKARLAALAADGRPGAAAAAYMKANLEGSLAGVQLGITLVGAVAAAVGGAGADERVAPLLQERFGLSDGVAEALALVAVVAPLTAVTIVFGELIPKVFALRNAEAVCLRLAPPMKWFVTAARPAVWALETAVTGLMRVVERRMAKPAASGESAEMQELRASAAMARTARLIGWQEERIILGAAALSRRPIRDVMLPAAAIRTLPADATAEDALVAAHQDMHTRFPLVTTPDDPQSIVGYVTFKDIVAQMRLAPAGPSLRAIMREMIGFADDLPVSAALDRLTRESAHIALVRDRTNAVVGLVTLEDIIEELVGDIEDEFDRLPAYVGRTGGGWVVGGGATPARLKAAAGIDLPAADGPPPRHLSDWVAARTGGVIQGGEVVTADGLRVVVRKVRRNKVQEAQVTRAPA